MEKKIQEEMNLPGIVLNEKSLKQTKVTKSRYQAGMPKKLRVARSALEDVVICALRIEILDQHAEEIQEHLENVKIETTRKSLKRQIDVLTEIETRINAKRRKLTESIEFDELQ